MSVNREQDALYHILRFSQEGNTKYCIYPVKVYTLFINKNDNY